MKHNLGNKPTLKVFPLGWENYTQLTEVVTQYEVFIRETFEHDRKMKEELEQLLEETKNFTSKLSTQRTHAYNRGCYDMLKEFLGQ